MFRTSGIGAEIVEHLLDRPMVFRFRFQHAAHPAAPDQAPILIDVRAPGERQQKRIAGSIGIPLTQLRNRVSELPPDRPLLVYCAGGYRSSIAASLLQRQGRSDVSEIAGGIAAWDAGKLPVET